jgi:hypothetical protein
MGRPHISVDAERAIWVGGATRTHIEGHVDIE